MTAPLAIRTARRDDTEAVLGLVQSAYRGDDARAGWTHEADLLDGQRADAAMITAAITAAHERVLLAEQDGVLMGCVHACDEGDKVYLGMLSVRPQAQAGGIGRQLIAAVEDLARKLGRARVEMTVLKQRPELIAYYERRGYRPTGVEKPFHDDPRFGVPRTPLALIVMEKRL